jgi:hypothetical protein
MPIGGPRTLKLRGKNIMRNVRLLQVLFGLMLTPLLPFKPAHAQLPETYLSGTGNDGADCSRLTPCRFFSTAFGKTATNGQITLLDASDYGVMLITRGVTIAGDASGASTHCCGSFGFAAGSGLSGHIVIAAGPSDVVTLRGLGVNGQGDDPSFGVWINDAGQVNIENCVVRNLTNTGIYVAPVAQRGFSNSLPGTMIINIEDTVVKGNTGGLRITSVPGVTVNALISRSSFQNNSGGGLRADTSSGGSISVDLVDSSVSLNGGNGINAIAGAGQNIVSIKNSTISRNGAAGVQANGVNAGVLLSATLLDQNLAGATATVNGGNMFTYGNNQIVGSMGSGFTATAPLQ